MSEADKVICLACFRREVSMTAGDGMTKLPPPTLKRETCSLCGLETTYGLRVV